MLSLKKYHVIFIALLSAGLVACSHSNPLRQYSHQQQAEDLFHSAVDAEMQLGLAKHRYQAGDYYFQCMSGQNPASMCHRLYHTMQSKLKLKYTDIRVSDIQDKKAWSFIKNYYRSELFNRMPG